MKMANNVFSKMIDATKGADIFGMISPSDYEQNMNPSDQGAYEEAVMGAFQEYYNSYLFSSTGTPLSFDMWVKTIDTESIEDQALKYSERKDSPVFRQQENFQKLSIADKLQKLAHLHTGRVEDLVDIVSAIDTPAPPAGQPAGMQPPQPGPGPLPQGIGESAEPY